MTYEQLSLPICQNVKSTVSDFHAKLSALLESETASQIQEALYSLKSCGWLKSESLNIYSLKTSKDCSTMRGGLRSRSSSEQWWSWGIAWNGKCLTAKTSEYPRIGKECSLSDILEEEVDEKYFLSRETIKRFKTYKDCRIEVE